MNWTNECASAQKDQYHLYVSLREEGEYSWVVYTFEEVFYEKKVIAEGVCSTFELAKEFAEMVAERLIKNASTDL